jgi:hypothetical protein
MAFSPCKMTFRHHRNDLAGADIEIIGRQGLIA